MDFQKAVLNFFKFVSKSILMSVVISIAGYCLLTRKFPPDFGRLKKMYLSYQKVLKLTQEIKASEQAKQSSPAEGQSAEDQEKDLNRMVEHRKQVLELLSQFNFTEPQLKQQNSEAKAALSDLENNPKSVLLSYESYNNLRLQIKELSAENAQLRQQLGQPSK